jgi:RND family efflux transporter MFP subunit
VKLQLNIEIMTKFKFNTQRTRVLTLAGIGILSIVVLVFAATKGGEEVPLPEVAPMTVETSLPVYEEITEWDEYTGRFEASNRVEVRARVSGFLEKVIFTDGQHVKKGQVLFIIDQRPFKIELEQAQASYAQAKADQKAAQDDFKRVESLRETGALSTEEYERRKQALAHSEASIQFAQAKVDNAKLNLKFTEVRAPITGLVSRQKVNEGNLIDGGSANSTLLTTIVATSPIHFYFTGSEADYLKYVRLARDGKRGAVRTEGVQVQIELADEEEFVHEGKIDFVDNEIDSQSGTIELRAVLQNENNLLEPGMFGKARILGSAKHSAIMVPDEIIGTNQSLRYVYVVGDNKEVVIKNVTLGPLHSNGLRIIRTGLTSGDKIIINNLQKIGPGMVVNNKLSTFNRDESSLAFVK